MPFSRELCTKCGHQHNPATRQRLIKRMVDNGLTPKEIKEAWPCFYPHKGPKDASERKLFRDLAEIRKEK